MISHLLKPFVCPRFQSDAKYREGHLRVVNALPQRVVLGLHTPEIKMISKNLSSKGGEIITHDGLHKKCLDGMEIIRYFEMEPSGTLCYEETVIWGYLINLQKCSLQERRQMLEKYVPVLDNWAVCDSFCANAKWMGHTDKDVLWDMIQPWFSSHKEFEVRFAVVVSMCHFLTDEWIDKVFHKLERIDLNTIKSAYISIKGKPERAQMGLVQGSEPYYVRMGIAWCLATALAKFPVQTRNFANASKLPEDVIRLYVRKARESFRTRTVKDI